jgi:hypothetical protein
LLISFSMGHFYIFVKERLNNSKIRTLCTKIYVYSFLLINP